MPRPLLPDHRRAGAKGAPEDAQAPHDGLDTRTPDIPQPHKGLYPHLGGSAVGQRHNIHCHNGGRLPLPLLLPSLILDAYTEEIIGWSVGPTLDTDYPMEALRMALRRIEGKDEVNLIHHSDRGCQYACREYVGMLRKHGIRVKA